MVEKKEQNRELDVEQVLKQQAALEKQLGFEKLLVECMMTLQQSSGLEGDMAPMFSKIGDFFEADRVYIFQVTSDNLMNNTHEWCAEGVSPEIDNLQGFPIEYIDHWLPYFEKRDSYILYDIEEARDMPDYEVLKPQGITSLANAPLYAGSRLVGYIGIDNPSPSVLENSASFFKSLGLFLSVEIEKNMTKEELRLMSYVDALTGLGNRNSFTQFVTEFDRKGPQEGFGVMYVDLNGLKTINDARGHAEGDVALKRMGEILRESFPSANVYRLGGDEFLVIARQTKQDDFEMRAERAREFLEQSDYSMAFGIYFAYDPLLLESAVRIADERMYEDKRNFYQGRKQESRHSEVFAHMERSV